jgi:hypothetical protein
LDITKKQPPGRSGHPICYDENCIPNWLSLLATSLALLKTYCREGRPAGDRLNDLSGRVIGCAFTVLNKLGMGFLKRSMIMRWYMNHARACIRDGGGPRGFAASRFTTITLVADLLLVELKTVNAPDDAHRIQCTNYLKATGQHLCLLLNFGRPRLAIKRVVHGL